MALHFTNDMQPKKNSLVVCAGTVTVKNVKDMGSGFSLFKKIFNKNLSDKNYNGGWQAELQDKLNNYFSPNPQSMPAYMRIASQGSFIGGIATVPCRAKLGERGLNPYLSIDEKQHENEFEQQYLSAVRQAVADAKELKRPLFLQPLGIGVYGWDKERAAQLFAAAICLEDPDDVLEITIPLYDQNENSADQLFKKYLCEWMDEFRENELPYDISTLSKPSTNPADSSVDLLQLGIFQAPKDDNTRILFYLAIALILSLTLTFMILGFCGMGAFASTATTAVAVIGITGKVLPPIFAFVLGLGGFLSTLNLGIFGKLAFGYLDERNAPKPALN